LIRYIVLKERGNEVKFSVIKVNIDGKEFKTKKEKIKVSLPYGREVLLKKDWFYRTIDEANRVSCERLIKYNFKESKKNKYGNWTCASCGRHVGKENVTVDHLIPILKFKKNGKYKDKKSWEMCWSEDNLTIMCVDCNSNKGYMSIKKHLTLNKKSTYVKLVSIKRKKSKIKTKSMKLAVRDSRILDANVILKKKSELWERIDEVKKNYDENRCGKNRVYK